VRRKISMKTGQFKLIDHWKKVIQEGELTGNFVHPDDQSFIGKSSVGNRSRNYPSSWDELIEAESKDSDQKFHLNLFPTPYMGDILNAKIYYLTGNPGYEHSDYMNFLTDDQSYRSLLRSNVEQKFSKSTGKFLYLTPDSAHTGGYRYWRSILNKFLLHLIRKNKGFDEKKVRSWLADNFAVLELTGYHSKAMKHSLIAKLPSHKLVKDFVHDYVIPKAERGECMVIVCRANKLWEVNLKPKNNVLGFSSSQARGGYISENFIKKYKSVFDRFTFIGD